jgi:hypothetical protein
MDLLRKSLFSIAAAALGLGTASATTINEPTVYLTGVQNGTVQTAFDPGSYFLTVNKFDSSLGTLQSILLTFNSSATYSLTVHATTTVHVIGNPQLSVGVEMLVTGPNDSFGDSIPLNFAVASVPVANINLLAGQDSGLITNGASPLTTHTTKSIDPTAFSYWTGLPGDTLSLDVSGVNSFNNVATQTGTFQINGTGTVAGDITVAYTYAASAPEPGTVGLLGAGLLACGFFLRKRKLTKG